jgi:hypothetical protein
MKTWICLSSLTVTLLIGCGADYDASSSGLTVIPSNLNPVICQPSWHMSVSGYVKFNGRAIDLDGAIASASAKHATDADCEGRVGTTSVSVSRRNGECYLWLTFQNRVLTDVVFDARGCGVETEAIYLRAKRSTLTWVKGLPDAVSNASGECLKSRTLGFGSRSVGLTGPVGDARLDLAGLKIHGDVWSAPDAALVCPRAVSW